MKKELPDLIVVDGGQPQVGAAHNICRQFQLKIPIIGLAKRQEAIIFKKDALVLNLEVLKSLEGQIFETKNFGRIVLATSQPLIKFLQRLRDSVHRLAVVYHRKLRTNQATASSLLSLPTIGLKTYQKLMRQFGSYDNLCRASRSQLSQILSKRQLEVLGDYLQLEDS